MKINKILLPLALLFSLSAFISPANADYNDGWDAFISDDFKTAAKEWTPLAAEGDAKSQTSLGILYFNGKGVLKDYKRAISLLTKAAEQGEAEAQFILGKIYVEGDGVIKSYKTAKHWVELAYESDFYGAEALWTEHELWKY